MLGNNDKHTNNHKIHSSAKEWEMNVTNTAPFKTILFETRKIRVSFPTSYPWLQATRCAR